MTLVGIIDAHDFRDEILRRRQALRARMSTASSPASAPPGNDAQVELLREIRDRLDVIAESLRDRSA
jgi:hypothetical protein